MSGLRKARKVRKLIAAGHSKCEARRIAKVKGAKHSCKRKIYGKT